MENNNIAQTIVFTMYKNPHSPIWINFATYAEFTEKSVRHYSVRADDIPGNWSAQESLGAGEMACSIGDVINSQTLPALVEHKTVATDVFVVRWDGVNAITLYRAALDPNTCLARWYNGEYTCGENLHDDGTTDSKYYKWFSDIHDAVDYMMKEALEWEKSALGKWNAWYERVAENLNNATKLRALIKSQKERKAETRLKKFDVQTYNGLMDWAERLDREQTERLQSLLETDFEMNKTLYYED